MFSKPDWLSHQKLAHQSSQRLLRRWSLSRPRGRIAGPGWLFRNVTMTSAAVDERTKLTRQLGSIRARDASSSYIF